MSIKATSTSISEAYTRTKNTMIHIDSTCQRAINRIDSGDLSCSLVIDDLVPNLNNLYNSLSDSALLPTDWVNKMDLYAKEQMLADISYSALYEQIRTETLTAIDLAISLIPVDENGNLLAYKYVDKAKTGNSISDYSTLKMQLEIVTGLIS